MQPVFRYFLEGREEGFQVRNRTAPVKSSNKRRKNDYTHYTQHNARKNGQRGRTEAHDVPNFDVGDVRADVDDLPDDFVARHQRPPGHPPVVVDHVEVGVADAAVRDDDVRVGFGQRLGGIGEHLADALGLPEAVSLDFGWDGG